MYNLIHSNMGGHRAAHILFCSKVNTSKVNTSKVNTMTNCQKDVD